VTATRGGNSRGGAQLTATGEKVLAAYLRLLETIARNRELARIAAFLTPPPSKTRPAVRKAAPRKRAG
jgi:molybdate transport repressor ModE-like protein